MSCHLVLLFLSLCISHSQCHVSIINIYALVVGYTIFDVELVWSLHSVVVNDMEAFNKCMRTSHNTCTHNIYHYQCTEIQKRRICNLGELRA
jgi:hypothetical protein